MPEPFLTLGFAHRDDFQGAWATIQSIRLHHPEILSKVEFVVIDNSPEGSQHSPKLQGVVANARSTGPVNLVKMSQLVGTSYTRAEIFKYASGKFVAFFDCHIFFAPGSLAKLIEFLEQNPESKDIYSGPLAWDSLMSGSDHFDPVWGGEMLGRWSVIWKTRDGRRFVCRENQITRNVDFHDDATRERVDLGFGSFGWAGHERILAERGCTLMVHSNEPYEIPGMGLGLCVIRKDAWPGMPEGLGGFGGEELHLHEVVRQKGGKAICLPFLKWLHRFGYVGATPYPNITEEKLRNNLVWEKHLKAIQVKPFSYYDYDPAKCVEHFREFIGGKADVQCRATMGEDFMGCGCQNKNADKAAESAAAPLDTSSIEAMYGRASTVWSDIYEHVPTLRQLSSQCDTVVEFGCRHGTSSVGILAGKPKKFVTVDLVRQAEVDTLTRLAGDTEFSFVAGSSLDVEIPECDLLFIDTVHTGEHVYKELTRHAAKCRRWIAFHDTQVYGEFGEGHSAANPKPGLLHGIRRFLRENTEWGVIRDDQNNYGFMVISRDQRDKPELPSSARQLWNFTTTMTKLATGGFELATEDVVEKRLDICMTCNLRNGDRCSDCGCWLVEAPASVPGRAMYQNGFCPLKKWGSSKWGPEVPQ